MINTNRLVALIIVFNFVFFSASNLQALASPGEIKPNIVNNAASFDNSSSLDNRAKLTQVEEENIDKLLKSGRILDLGTTAPSVHKINSTFNLSNLRLQSIIQMSSIRPIKAESDFDRPITLKEALNSALDNNLSIKISKESYNYQNYQLYGSISSSLPSLLMSYNTNYYNVLNKSATANAQIFQTRVNYPVFQGGAVLYSVLGQYYRQRGWKFALYTTVNDALLDVYMKYTNLMLNHALLQIRAKSVEVSAAQLALNQSLNNAGTGTKFAVMQSMSQLAADRQAYLQQQVTVRQASLALAFALNFPMAVNLVPAEQTIQEVPIVDSQLDINKLLLTAMATRPELKQYQLFKLAANRNIQVTASPLYPTASFFTMYSYSGTTVTPGSSGSALGGVASGSIASALNSSFAGRATNNALGQKASFSPTSTASTANTGANTGAATLPAASGGLPIANIQSGSAVTSGAVAPAIAIPGASSGVTGALGSSTSNTNGSFTSGAGIFPGIFDTYQQGFSLAYFLNGMGLVNVANILSAKTLSRQSQMQANQELQLVIQQVRGDYLSMLISKEQIDNAAYGSIASAEALRLAKIRIQTGVGTNLELIQAQRDYVNSLITQVQAIITNNQSQAQLVHDIGTISVDKLTKGYSL